MPGLDERLSVPGNMWRPALQIPDYAVFRCGHLISTNDDYDRLHGSYDKQELYAGCLPSALCWPPPASFTWDWKRLLLREGYQALSFLPGWQTELYRGMVLAWTSVEAVAVPVEIEWYGEEAKCWIEKHVPAALEEQNA